MGAAHAEADETHAHRLQTRGGEAEHGLLAGGTRRSLGDDGAFLPMPVGGVGVLRQGLRHQSAGAAEGEQRGEQNAFEIHTDKWYRVED